MEKKAGNAEGCVGDLARRLLLLEENAVKADERLYLFSINLQGSSGNFTLPRVPKTNFAYKTSRA